jgi:hypothetical protein
MPALFHRQVEGFAGGREAEGTEQHQGAGLDGPPDGGLVDPPHQAAVDEVDAVDDAHRARGQEVARDHAHGGVGHRRIRQALGEGRLDLEAQLAGGFLGRVERDFVGDAQAALEARDMALGRQLLGHLRPEAVHHDQLDAHGVQDGQVLHEGVEFAGGNGLAGQRHHEGLAAVGVNVGRHRAKPGHEGVRENKAHRAPDCAAGALSAVLAVLAVLAQGRVEPAPPNQRPPRDIRRR